MKSFPIALAAAIIGLGSTPALAQKAGPPQPGTGPTVAPANVAVPALSAAPSIETGSAATPTIDAAPVSASGPAVPVVTSADALAPTSSDKTVTANSATAKAKKKTR